MSSRGIATLSGVSTLVVALVLAIVGLSGDDTLLIAVAAAVALLGVGEMIFLPRILGGAGDRTGGRGLKR